MRPNQIAAETVRLRLRLRLKTYQLRNRRVLRRIREAFQLALILLIAEIVASLFAIAGMSKGS